MKLRTTLLAITSLTLPGAALAQGSASIVTDKREKPRYEERRASDVTVTMTAIGDIVALHDGIIQIQVAGQRFESKPDPQTRFTADKKTALAGRKNLKLEDFFVGAPVKLTFVADSGRLLEVRMRYQKAESAAQPPR